MFRQPAARRRPGWLRLGPLIAVGVVLVLVANAVRRRLSLTHPIRAPATTTVSTSPSPPRSPVAPLGAEAESAKAVVATERQSQAESQPPAPESAKAPAPTPTAEPAGAAPVQRRYATTWINLRANRSNTAPVTRILRPGELIMVDLLQRGWYRVVTDGEALGYVDQRYLDTSPPPDLR